jgi:hypothetical protein
MNVNPTSIAERRYRLLSVLPLNLVPELLRYLGELD